MGLSDWLGGGDGDDPDELDEEDRDPDRWRIICRDEQGRAAKQPDGIEPGEWRFEGEPPDKQQFQYQYGAEIEPGIEYICVAQETGTDTPRPDFDRIKWTYSEEPTYERDEMDEMRRLIEEKLDGGTIPGGDEPFEDRLLQAVIMGQVDLGTAEQVVELKSQLESAKNPSSKDYFEDADMDRPGQLMAAAGMNLLQSYDSVGDAVEDVLGGAVAAGPAASVPQRPPQQPEPPEPTPAEPEPAAEAADPTPDDVGQSSTASKHADRMAELVGGDDADDDAPAEPDAAAVAADSEIAASAAVVEEIDGDGDTDTDDAPGWTAADVPDSPEEVDEALREDFPSAEDADADADTGTDTDTDTQTEPADEPDEEPTEVDA